MDRFYIETGTEINASGAAVQVFCVMDERDHRQVGPALSISDEAEEWVDALNAHFGYSTPA